MSQTNRAHAGAPLSTILLQIYDNLLAAYGPQHWWPGEEPFEVIVGAILTQSTAWSNVEKAIGRLKSSASLSVAAINSMPPDTLARLIYPSGYYNVKARRLQMFTQWLTRDYGGNLDRLSAIETAMLRQQLLSLNGIGEETADSILLYAANRPVFVVDAYTRRIFQRAGLFPHSIKYGEAQSIFMRFLPADRQVFNEYHALLVHHGKDVCCKRPRCGGCAISGFCAHVCC